MPTPKKRPGRKPASQPAEPPAGMSIRGLTPEDHAALERAVARRKAAIGGGFVSLNNTVLSLMRSALAREDATGAIDVAPTGATS